MIVRSPRRSTLRFLLLTTLLVGAMSVRASADDQRAILELIVNETRHGEELVLLRGADLLMAASALERVGLRAFGGTRERLDEVEYVSLASLAPRVTFVMSEQDLTIRLTAKADLFEPTLVNLDRSRPANITYTRSTSAFVNYSANWRGASGHDLFAETGLHAGGALFLNGLSYSSSGGVLRGFTNATIDDRDRLTRYIVGDGFFSAGPLGGGAVLVGVNVAREYALDPYFVRYPTVGLSAAATTPSVVEVYVNDQLVRREQVPAGQFELRNLPVSNGASNTRLVIRDAFGREQQISSSFYLTTSVLARGLHEFRYGLGWPRRNAGVANWDYGKLTFLGRHRYGVTDNLTLGARLEGRSGLVSGGPAVTLRTPIGELEAMSAWSRQDGVWGNAAWLAFNRSSRLFSIGGGAGYMTPRYATTSLHSFVAKPRIEARLFAGVQVWADASLSLEQSVSLDGPDGDVVRSSVSAQRRLTESANLSLTASHASRDHDSGMEMSVGVGWLLGPRTSGTLSYDRGIGQEGAIAELQRSLPAGTGYGYRMQLLERDGAAGLGVLQYQGQYGRYEAHYDQFGSQRVAGVTAAGGVVLIGGGLFATRPVQESFALLQVPGVGGVRAYASNQEIGRTDARGNLLIPNLLPYYANSLSIEDMDIPFNYSVGSTNRTIAPPYRGGTLVSFPVSRVQTMSGRVLLHSGAARAVPAFGDLTIEAGGRRYESPLGSAGEFYFENLPPGRHKATLTFRTKTCGFVVAIPKSTKDTLNLGTMTCTTNDAV